MKLLNEVIDHAPDDLTPGEMLVLVVLAYGARDTTRECWPGMDVLSQRTRLHPNSVTKVLRRLAERGLDVRVPMGTDARGRTFYAARGRQSTYRLPDLKAKPSAHLSPPQSQAISSPLDEESQAERHLKVSPTAPKGEPSAWPVSHEESLEVKTLTTPASVGRLLEPLATIAGALADQHPTIDELKAIHRAVIDAHHPRDVIQYCRGIVGKGGFASYLAAVRQAAAEQRRKDIDRQRRIGPWCEHGEVDHVLPSGVKLCPLCRHDLAEPPLDERPDVVRVLNVYRSVYGTPETTADLLAWARIAAQVVAAEKGQTT